MNELERLTKLVVAQKELINVLQEGAEKNAKIIELYKKTITSQESVIESLHKLLSSSVNLLSKYDNL